MLQDLENQLIDLGKHYPGVCITVTVFEYKISYRVSVEGNEDVNFRSILEMVEYLDKTEK